MLSFPLSALHPGRSLSHTPSIHPCSWSTNMTALAGMDAVFCSPGWGCPGTAVDVAFPDSYETSLAGVSEMGEWGSRASARQPRCQPLSQAPVRPPFCTPSASPPRPDPAQPLPAAPSLPAVLFMSLFYNVETTANALIRNVRTRIACTEAVVADAAPIRAAAAARLSKPAPTKPRVLWAYNYFGAWYVGSCPNYYCEAIAAAGGEVVIPDVPGSGSWGSHTDDQMVDIVSNADIWLYASDNWDSAMAPALAGEASGIKSVLTASRAVTGASKAVFDFMRRGTNAWFEERPSQPDLLVQDLITIISPDAFALTGARNANGRAGSATHTR